MKGRAELKLFIGTSGFHYKEWKGEFYPEKLAQKNWLEFYCRHFNTLELNSTFYRFPRIEFLRHWYARSPVDFRFSVKAPRLISHFYQFRNCERYLSDFYGTIAEGLENKLGPVLFQFPSSMTFKKETLDLIIESLYKNFTNVLEFRHSSWWSKEVYDRLGENNIVFSGISHPDLPDTPIINTPTFYYRFHGVPRLYYSEYEVKHLRKIANAIRKIKPLKQAFFYYNNTAGLSALNNARWMQEYFGLSSISMQAGSWDATDRKKS